MAYLGEGEEGVLPFIWDMQILEATLVFVYTKLQLLGALTQTPSSSLSF